jgi:hypothetical protein
MTQKKNITPVMTQERNITSVTTQEKDNKPSNSDLLLMSLVELAIGQYKFPDAKLNYKFSSINLRKSKIIYIKPFITDILYDYNLSGHYQWFLQQ